MPQESSHSSVRLRSRYAKFQTVGDFWAKPLIDTNARGSDSGLRTPDSDRWTLDFTSRWFVSPVRYETLSLGRRHTSRNPSDQ